MKKSIKSLIFSSLCIMSGIAFASELYVYSDDEDGREPDVIPVMATRILPMNANFIVSPLPVNNIVEYSYEECPNK